MLNSPPILLVGNFLYEKTGLRTISEDFASLLVSSGLSILTTSHQPARIARLLDMLSTVWIRRKHYRLACIDTYSGPAFFWAECVGFTLWLLGKPFILILHGGGLPQFAGFWPGRVKRLLRLAAAVTSPSPYLKEKMQQYRSDIKVIPNPLNLDAYHYCLRKKAAPVLIWLRAFHRIYNPSLAIRVLAELEKVGIKPFLIMVGPDKGDGSLEETLQLATQLDLMAQIRVVAGIPKEEVPIQLSEGDIFMNTTNIDNMPVSVMEAMASGLCIVSTNVGGIPYLLEHTKDALLVAPDDEKAMAAAIQQVLTRPQLASHLSMNARKKAELFDWPAILPQWEELFTRVAND
jgi:glycosyltransferase involved in cell wall biosynthesis